MFDIAGIICGSIIAYLIIGMLLSECWHDGKATSLVIFLWPVTILSIPILALLFKIIEWKTIREAKK